MLFHVVAKGDRAVWIAAGWSRCQAEQTVKELTKRSVYEGTLTAPYNIRSFWKMSSAEDFIEQSRGQR